MATVHVKLEHLHGVEDVAQLVELACLACLESWSSSLQQKPEAVDQEFQVIPGYLVGSKSA